jgi:hypothetical protein
LGKFELKALACFSLISTRDGSAEKVADKKTTLRSYATVIDTDLGGGTNDAPAGNMSPSSVGYTYSLLGSGSVASKVPGEAGAILSF